MRDETKELFRDLKLWDWRGVNGCRQPLIGMFHPEYFCLTTIYACFRSGP